MDHETAGQIMEGIERTKLQPLRLDAWKAAVEYAHLRAEWFLAHQDLLTHPGDGEIRESFGALDRRRTLAHEALLDRLRLLGREMRKRGEDVRWWDLLPKDASGQLDRAEAGDLACLLHLRLGLAAR